MLFEFKSKTTGRIYWFNTDKIHLICETSTNGVLNGGTCVMFSGDEEYHSDEPILEFIARINKLLNGG